MATKLSVEEVKASFAFSLPLQVRYSDIDGYMHVNNGVYFNYFEHARAMYLFKVCDWDILEIGSVVANIDIDFFRPIHVLDQPVCYVRCTQVGRSSFTLEQVILGLTAQGEEKVFARAHTIMVSVDMKTMQPVPVPAEYVDRMQQPTESPE
ncbi:thioesterase superfamily protein [Nitritalea halalkaliphila LW7]|uniref:Thioesterase superfamily protein n=1 Tax=Nitritalea halalkaliphila LW7 TaxID=1189621 RepID=I5BYB1_9BACT|nr:thioesterase family protein [Nitritalea halalkaliphila]EIM74563.1 thioesterase superfamily protein [Nitritalea halalkaliphila LW7]